MPAKPKNTQRSKTEEAPVRAPIAPSTDVDLLGNESSHVVRHEPVVALPLAEAPCPISLDAMEQAIAKEDAKIIAKASARALRRGLH